jgi:hypothetical protein
LRTFVAGPDPTPADRERMFCFELDGRLKTPKVEGYNPGKIDRKPKPVSAITHFARFLDSKKLLQLPPDEPKTMAKKR